MNINSILFPAPTTKIDLTKYKNEILFIPKPNLNQSSNKFIPCMLYESRKNVNSNKYLLYFHGNAEDIFNSNYTVDLTRTVLPYNTISVEYPGYSIYYEDKDEKTINEDSVIVYDYLISNCSLNSKDIIICGRSIGSGPSIYLCSKRKPAALILISAFTSICSVVKSLLGSFMSMIVKERFVNIDLIDKVTSPVLFIHGQKDKVVPFEHTIELSRKCCSPMEVVLPEEMDHNEIQVYDDFLEPLTCFLNRFCLLDFDDSQGKVCFPKEVFIVPECFESGKENKDYVSSFVRRCFNK
jgi:hypothetical protein